MLCSQTKHSADIVRIGEYGVVVDFPQTPLEKKLRTNNPARIHSPKRAGRLPPGDVPQNPARRQVSYLQLREMGFGDHPKWLGLIAHAVGLCCVFAVIYATYRLAYGFAQ